MFRSICESIAVAEVGVRPIEGVNSGEIQETDSFTPSASVLP